MSNRLVDILREAKKAGFNQWERHAISLRYREAVEEYLRVQPRPQVNTAKSMIDYFNAMEEHGAIKARGYMERHEGGRYEKKFNS